MTEYPCVPPKITLFEPYVGPGPKPGKREPTPEEYRAINGPPTDADGIPYVPWSEMSVDELLGQFWEVCEEFEGFSFVSDQWWLLSAECGHGKFITDPAIEFLHRGLLKLLVNFDQAEH